MEGGTPVRLWEHDGVWRVQGWLHLAAKAYEQRYVYIGQLRGRGWFVEDGPDAVVDLAEEQARELAVRQMAGAGPWVEVPARFRGGKPDTPGPWAKRGNVWVRAED